MKIGRSTSYAVIASCYIGQQPPKKTVLSHDISKKYDIPLEYLLKILQQSLDGKFPIYNSNDDLAIYGVQGSVNDQNVIMVDPGPGHRITIDPDEEGGGRILDQEFIEIQTLFNVIFGGRRESG